MSGKSSSFDINLLSLIEFIYLLFDLLITHYPKTFVSKALEAVCPTKDDPKRIDWSETMEQFFIELLLEQVRKGNKIGRTFKKKSWVCMISSFNAKFGVQYSRYVLRNRYNILRRHYSNIKILLGLKGFNFDKAQKRVVADDVVWNDYVKVSKTFISYCHLYVLTLSAASLTLFQIAGASQLSSVQEQSNVMLY